MEPSREDGTPGNAKRTAAEKEEGGGQARGGRWAPPSDAASVQSETSGSGEQPRQPRIPVAPAQRSRCAATSAGKERSGCVRGGTVFSLMKEGHPVICQQDGWVQGTSC